jgi:hypothetical protein
VLIHHDLNPDFFRRTKVMVSATTIAADPGRSRATAVGRRGPIAPRHCARSWVALHDTAPSRGDGGSPAGAGAITSVRWQPRRWWRCGTRARTGPRP